jgi:two-component system LytT family response regulator
MSEKSSEAKEISSPQTQHKNQEYLQRFLIKSSGKHVFINTSDIWWIESSGNYVQIHLSDSRYLIRGSLKKMEEKLDPEKFVRVHQSTLVNVKKIKYTEPALYGSYEIVLKNEEKLKMSRTYKEALDEYYLNI